MNKIITNLALSFLAVTSLASEPRFTDHKYNVSFPEQIGDLRFGSMSISKGHIYEVRYEGELGTHELEFDLIPNERTYPIFEGKICIAQTKPVSELSNDELLGNNFYGWKSTNSITLLSDWQDYTGISYCTYSYTSRFSIDAGSCDNPLLLQEKKPPHVSFVCLSIFKFKSFTLIVTRKFKTAEDLKNTHEQKIDQIKKLFSNQGMDPTR